MASGKPRFYWDTAPLIAWIIDEKRDDSAEMSGLAEVLDMVDRGNAILMTSVLWRAEVFDISLTPAQRKRLVAAFDGRSIIELGIDGRVMDLTSQKELEKERCNQEYSRSGCDSPCKCDSLRRHRVPYL